MSLKVGFPTPKNLTNLINKNYLSAYIAHQKKITKSIMSPMISATNGGHNEPKIYEKRLFKEKNKLMQIRKFIEKNFEYVGEDFSKKVREIYYDKKTKKTIYGTTTDEERKELAEEGIDLLTIPWVDKDN